MLPLPPQMSMGCAMYSVTRLIHTSSDAARDQLLTPLRTFASVAAQAVVAPTLPGLRAECLKKVACLYTTTPDWRFVLDTHPAAPQVLIASPCSGHGFKHSAAIGEVLAELVTEGKSRIDISSFALSRFESADPAAIFSS